MFRWLDDLQEPTESSQFRWLGLQLKSSWQAQHGPWIPPLRSAPCAMRSAITLCIGRHWFVWRKSFFILFHRFSHARSTITMPSESFSPDLNYRNPEVVEAGAEPTRMLTLPLAHGFHVDYRAATLKSLSIWVSSKYQYNVVQQMRLAIASALDKRQHGKCATCRQCA